MKAVSLFHWNLVSNWGDRLSPLLLQRFAQVEPVWAPVDEAEVVCVGSLLGNLAKPNFTGYVLGSGKLFEDGIVPPHAHILALRGPLSAVGVEGTFALGDPGLLADELVTVNEKIYELGIVPHWSDHKLALDLRFQKYKPTIIHSGLDPLEVVRRIGACKKIVSSSLHGLIVADAFNIPRRFETTAAWNKEGGTFKVRDHCAALDLPFEVSVAQQANSNRVDDARGSPLGCLQGLWRPYERPAVMDRQAQSRRLCLYRLRGEHVRTHYAAPCADRPLSRMFRAALMSAQASYPQPIHLKVAWPGTGSFCRHSHTPGIP